MHGLAPSSIFFSRTRSRKSRCLAPSQRRGRLGRARRHTADAVRHWATSLASATPSTKPCSRFLGAKSAATSHRARSSMRPAKAGSKSTRDSILRRAPCQERIRGIVKICLVESQGGIAPPTKRIIFNFAKEVGSPSAVDRTDYGTASGSARGFAQHHSQQLSRAAVCGDAQNINNAARNMRVAHSFMTGLNAPPPPEPTSAIARWSLGCRRPWMPSCSLRRTPACAVRTGPRRSLVLEVDRVRRLEHVPPHCSVRA